MTLPNMLTALRMVLSIWFGIEFCRGNIFLAFFIFVFACVSDVADVFIARRFNMVSEAGKLMDPVADKLMLIIGIGCLVYTGTVNSVYIFILAAKELIMIVGSLYYLNKGTVVFSRKYGKATSVFFTIGIGSGMIGMPHLAAGFLSGAFCCALFAMGYYALYFSN